MLTTTRLLRETVIMARITVILLLGILLVSGFACGGDGEPGPTPTPTTTPTPTLTPTREPGVIYITAERLCDDYDKNKVAADHEYKGNILEVSGKVKEIARDPLNDMAYLTLNCGRYLLLDCRFLPSTRVWCYFDRADESLFTPIEIGDIVSVRGECKGYSRFHPQLEHCTSIQFID